MTTKIKTVLLAVFYMLSAAISMHAQQKYEYAVINYTPHMRDLTISINGNEYKVIEVTKEQVKGFADVNPAFIEMNKMIDNDWELFTTEVTEFGIGKSYAFFLRR